jgi:hypothetical protein
VGGKYERSDRFEPGVSTICCAGSNATADVTGDQRSPVGTSCTHGKGLTSNSASPFLSIVLGDLFLGFLERLLSLMGFHSDHSSAGFNLLK